MNGPIVDSHCHLDFADFADGDGGRNGVLTRGRGEGIVWFVSIGAGRGTASAIEAVALAERHADVVATVGIHPHDAVLVTDEAMEAMEALAARARVVAVGEVGLDYHYEHSPRGAQRDAFRWWVALARRRALPLVIHTREAADDTLAILREEGARDVGGVIHCFSEDTAFARATLDMGFDLSLSGVVTFRNAENLRAVARTIPLDRLLIETDSPYLAPIPHRGQRNEPAFLSATAHHLAGTLGISEADLRAQTTVNAVRRFGLGRFVNAA